MKGNKKHKRMSLVRSSALRSGSKDYFTTIKYISFFFMTLILISFFTNSYRPQEMGSNDNKNIIQPDNGPLLEPKTSSLITENLSVNSGDLLGVNTEYNFNGTFYDDSSYTKEYTEAYLETKLIGDDTTFNDSISGVNNSELITFSPSGLFTGTYSFTGIAEGSNDPDWVDDSTGTGYAYVVSSYQEHDNVIKFFDGTGVGELDQTFTDGVQTSGTIEWWMASPDVTKQFKVHITDGVTVAVAIGLDSSKIRYYNGAWHDAGLGAVNDQWYHIRVDFNTVTDLFDLYVDGILYQDDTSLNGDRASIDGINPKTGTVDAYGYLDAVGYSWGSGYSVGDNRFPVNMGGNNGTYDYTDEMGTLDGTATEFYSQDLETDYNLYDSDITMINGSYDSNGTISIFDDDYHIFSSIGEVYNATYTFTDDNDGSDPADWVITETDADQIEVLNDLDGHSKVVKIITEAGGDYAIIENVFAQSSGTVEFWFRAGQNNLAHYTCFTDASSEGIHLYWKATGAISYYSGGYHDIGTYNADQWYHVKVEFDTATDWHLWIDGVSYDGGAGYGYHLTPDGATMKTILNSGNGAPEAGSLLWIDAVGYSWDSNYDIGDNLNPILNELNFTSVFHSDSTRYNNMTLFYAQQTDIDQIINISLYNDDLDQWDIINSSSVFDDLYLNSYQLNESYFNTTNDLIVEIKGYNLTNDFEFYLDILQVKYEEHILNFTLEIPFIEKSYLALNISSYYKSDNQFQNISFSVYSFTDHSWVLINDSQNSEAYYLSYYFSNSSVTDLFNVSSYIRLNFYGINATETINASIDYLEAKVVSKLDLSITKSFNVRGVWKYRFHLVGSDYYSNWTYFEVVTPEPNFEGISESEYTTHWYLISQELVPEITLYDDMEGDSWALYNVPIDTIHTNQIPTDDSYVYDGVPFSGFNYGSSTVLVSYNNNPNDAYMFLKYEYLYLDENVTDNSEFFIYTASASNSLMSIYNTSDFDESTITWDTMPVLDDLMDTTSLGTGWNLIPLGSEPQYYYGIMQENDGTVRYNNMRSSESIGYEPRFRHHFSKFFYGNSLAYIQTNITETLSMFSPDYGDTVLSKGDTISVSLKSLAPDITMRLYLDGSPVKDLSLLSGNVITTNQTIEVILDESIIFDRIMFSGVFDDTEYLMCYDIEISHLGLSDDMYDFYVDPDGMSSIFANPGNYTLKVYEYIDNSFSLKLEKNITLTLDALYSEIYVPTTLTYHYLTVYHYAVELSTLDVFGPQNISTTLGYNEIKYLKLLEGSYSVNWTNGENGIITTYNILLDSDNVLTLDTTYFQIYIAVYNFDGFGIDKNTFKLYINGTRKEPGFNTVAGNYVNLVLQDFWDYVVYNQTIKINATTYEFNIEVELYNLIINNNYLHNIRVEIYRAGFSGNITQLIPGISGFSFRFYPGVQYNIITYYTNDTVIENKTVLLDYNNKPVNFGFYEEEVPVIPESNVPVAVLDIIIVLILFSLIIVVLTGVVIYVSKKYKQSVRQQQQRENKIIRNKYKLEDPMDLRR